MESTRIALVQFQPDLNDPDGNAAKHREYIRRAAGEGAALICFPECSLTGYTTAQAAEVALPLAHPLVQSVREACAQAGIAGCFGFIERRPKGLSLAQVLTCGQEFCIYRKTHLGSKEQGVFLAGDSFPVLPAPRVTGMQLCWETHIPEISGLLRAQGAELLLTPYASGMTGQRCREDWGIHLPARASDNGAYLAACNLFLPNGKGGGMAVYDPKGRLIASWFEPGEHMLVCDLTGPLPRELPPGDMHNISYFDKKRTELFRRTATAFTF